MTLSDTFLQRGKDEMDTRLHELRTVFDIEIASTEIAQDMSSHLTEEMAKELLLERPEFFNVAPRWAEDQHDEYFTVYWVLVHLLSDWLNDELERYGKEKLLSISHQQANREAVHLSLSYTVQWKKENQELTIFSPEAQDTLDSAEVVNLVRFLDSIRGEIEESHRMEEEPS